MHIKVRLWDERIFTLDVAATDTLEHVAVVLGRSASLASHDVRFVYMGRQLPPSQTLQSAGVAGGHTVIAVHRERLQPGPPIVAPATHRTQSLHRDIALMESFLDSTRHRPDDAAAVLGRVPPEVQRARARILRAIHAGSVTPADLPQARYVVDTLADMQLTAASEQMHARGLNTFGVGFARPSTPATLRGGSDDGDSADSGSDDFVEHMFPSSRRGDTQDEMGGVCVGFAFSWIALISLFVWVGQQQFIPSRFKKGILFGFALSCAVVVVQQLAPKSHGQPIYREAYP